LDLGLLIHAQHHGSLGRVQVEPDDVADLVDELRIFGELPGLLAVRLQPERPPDAQHRRLRQADLARHRPGRPVRGVLGRALQRLDDHLLDLLVGDRARPSGTRLVDEAVEAVLHKARTPLTGHIAMDSELAGDLRVVASVGRQQHDPRAQRERLRTRAPTRPRLQLATLNGRQRNRLKHRGGHDHTLPTCPRINASRH